MKALSAGTVAALSAGSVAIVQFAYLGFPSPIALNSSNWNLDWDGVTYKGAYGLGEISPVTDKPGEVQGLTLQLFGDSAAIALALDDSDMVQGTQCVLRTGIIETQNYTVLDAPVEWAGYLDAMSISEDGEKALIQVSAESKAVDLLRGTPMFYSDSDQRTVNPNDRSFKYVIDQMDKPIIWPARTFYYK